MVNGVCTPGLPRAATLDNPEGGTAPSRGTVNPLQSSPPPAPRSRFTAAAFSTTRASGRPRWRSAARANRPPPSPTVRTRCDPWPPSTPSRSIACCAFRGALRDVSHRSESVSQATRPAARRPVTVSLFPFPGSARGRTAGATARRPRTCPPNRREVVDGVVLRHGAGGRRGRLTRAVHRTRSTAGSREPEQVFRFLQRRL